MVQQCRPKDTPSTFPTDSPSRNTTHPTDINSIHPISPDFFNPTSNDYDPIIATESVMQTPYQLKKIVLAIFLVDKTSSTCAEYA